LGWFGLGWVGWLVWVGDGLGWVDSLALTFSTHIINHPCATGPISEASKGEDVWNRFTVSTVP
jgi:hypothetical protein